MSLSVSSVNSKIEKTQDGKNKEGTDSSGRRFVGINTT